MVLEVLVQHGVESMVEHSNPHHGIHKAEREREREEEVRDK
jgi:hypothetical protein